MSFYYRTLNKIKKDRAIKENKRFWFKRIGKCDPSICGGACCRYSVANHNTDAEYHNLITVPIPVKIIKTKTKVLEVIAINCPNITIDGKCCLHGKKKQPYTCDVFPMHPEDGTYILVKKYCSYKFIKIKNDRYKRINKRSEKVQ